MSIIFFLFSLVSYVRGCIYVLGWEAAVGQGSPPPFFLGVAIGLLLRIMLLHMLGLAFVAVGAFADDLLLVQVFVFVLQALSSPAPLSFPRAGTSSEVTHPGASPFFSLPPFRRAG